MQNAMPLRARRFCVALHATPWLSLLGYALLAVMYGMIASLFLPSALGKAMRHGLLATPLAMLVTKELAGLPQFLARMKARRWRERLAAAPPPELIGWIRLERTMWAGFFSWLARRSPPMLPEGQRLTYLERGPYQTMIAIVLVALIIEAPLDVMMATLVTRSAQQALLIHVLAGLAWAYSLVWLLGDRWHVLGQGCHVLAGDRLHIRVGARTFGTIPLDAIERCEPVASSRAAWCKARGINLRATLLVSAFGAPNLVLLIKPGCAVALTHMQQATEWNEAIFLYVDRPDLLAAEINRR